MGIQLSSILKGHVNEVLGLNSDIARKRLSICHKCPIFKNILGGICNGALWINPETNEISLNKIDGYVKGCGCRLEAKTTLMNAECPAGKW